MSNKITNLVWEEVYLAVQSNIREKIREVGRSTIDRDVRWDIVDEMSQPIKRNIQFNISMRVGLNQYYRRRNESPF